MNTKAKAAAPRKEKSLDFSKFGKAAQALEALSQPTAANDAMAKLSDIDRKPQVRKSFIAETLQALGENIQAVGLLQPILLRKKRDGRFDLVAGERRVRGAEMVGILELPYRLVPDDVTDLDIRRMQVAENMLREDLTPYEQAAGVAEDVQKYGPEEAARMWGRSPSWVAKRVMVEKMPAPVVALFRDGFVADIEMLIALQNILAIDEKEFSIFVSQIESGATLTREQVRDRESVIKGRKAAASEREQRIEGREVRQGAGSTGSADKPRKDDDEPSSKLKKKTSGQAAAVKQESAAATDVERDATPPTADSSGDAPSVQSDGEQSSHGPSLASVRTKLSTLREEMYEWGIVNRQQFLQLDGTFDQLTAGGDSDAEPEFEDWVKWSSFLSLLLPVVDVLGKTKSEIFMRRLAQELKKAPAVDIWNNLHPVKDGEDPTNPQARRDAAPEMPKGWRL